eukprot:4319769-Ditylum_brightwellii.AAC.1
MTHPFLTPLALPRLPYHLFQQYDAPDASLMQGDNVICCSFARDTDPRVVGAISWFWDQESGTSV